MGPRLDLAAKVAFLGDPAAYGARARHVESIETHMSWVFLTDGEAWKLKKPLRLEHRDLRGVAARERHCRMELRLNRRFSPDVYLDVVPLRRDARGRLSLGGPGATEDWLLLMRKLPPERMLDAALRAHRVDEAQVRTVADQLARFYAMARPQRRDGAALRARIARRIRRSERELLDFATLLPRDLVGRLAREQIAFLEANAALFDARAAAGLIVEGHGDLRPEHVCLLPIPRIIDCLEFSRQLRIVDPAEELGFLALECERLGAPWVREALFETYSAVSGDRPDRRLVHFHQSCHACVRARLAIAHLRDASPRRPERWAPLARDYLALAAAHLAAAGHPECGEQRGEASAVF